MRKYFIFKTYVPFNGIKQTRFDLRLSQQWTWRWRPSAPRSPILPLSFRFSHRNLVRICLLSHACHMPVHLIIFDSPLWRCGPAWAMTSFLEFLDHTRRPTTVGITPVDGWSARCMDLYLTTHNTNSHTSMSPGGVRIHRLSKRATADLHLRHRHHWDLPYLIWSF
jgi:hypothetical protein